MTARSTCNRAVSAAAVLAATLIAVTGCGSGGSDTSASTTPSTVAVTQSVPVSGAASASPAEATSTQSATAKPVTRVDIEEFAGYGSGGKGYFFQSPSGIIKCAIKLQDPAIAPGCIAEVPVPDANGVSCPGNLEGFYLTVIENGSAVSKCEVGGTPHVANDNGDNGLPAGGRDLNPGESVSADGVTCTAILDEVKCTVDGSGRGFTMGVKVNETF